MTFTKTSILALAALAITAPAYADNASLARSVGVEPGVYSVQQLIELKALTDGESARRDNILDNPAGTGADVATRAQSATVTSSAKLAASVGVAPGTYSVEQLIELKALAEEGDNARRDYIIENPASAGVATRTGTADDGAKLAVSLGVQPGLYSVPQLIELRSLNGNDQARAQFILANPAYGS